MNHTTMMLTPVMVFAFLATAVLGMPEVARAQGNTPSAKTAELPFTCNRLALTPEQRKRHFDELSPKLLLLKKSVGNSRTATNLNFRLTPRQFNSWRNGQSASVPAVHFSTSTCGWNVKAGRSGWV
jgi:hypothetical protein